MHFAALPTVSKLSYPLNEFSLPLDKYYLYIISIIVIVYKPTFNFNCVVKINQQAQKSYSVCKGCCGIMAVSMLHDEAGSAVPCIPVDLCTIVLAPM